MDGVGGFEGFPEALLFAATMKDFDESLGGQTEPYGIQMESGAEGGGGERELTFTWEYSFLIFSH